jgi:hypothetical protein
MTQNTAIGVVRERMMALVNDHQAKGLGEALEARLPLERLHTGHDHIASMLIALGFDHADITRAVPWVTIDSLSSVCRTSSSLWTKMSARDCRSAMRWQKMIVLPLPVGRLTTWRRTPRKAAASMAVRASC